MAVQTEQVPHHIVIIGGGAGGLELATQLGDSFAKSKWVKITLVDQNLTHIWKPLLHEIAAGTLNPSVEEINYFAHASKHHYEFVLGRFVGLDQEHKQVKLEARQYAKQSTETTQFELNYDTLVLAVGSTSNDFATEGAKHYCHFLDSRQQAEIFQQDLLHLYLDAQTVPKHAHSILRLLVQVPQESSLLPNWSMRKVPFLNTVSIKLTQIKSK